MIMAWGRRKFYVVENDSRFGMQYKKLTQTYSSTKNTLEMVEVEDCMIQSKEI